MVLSYVNNMNNPFRVELSNVNNKVTERIDIELKIK